jgi:RNA-binding motif X-linked protein 2
MNAIRQTQKLNERELELVTPPQGSWHRDYQDTAFIYVGGLPFELSEGDIITIFSQYGEPVFINLIRDKETGKSKGFCYIKYEDQRSCDLAVDNLGGATVMGRMLNVDHNRYKPKENEKIYDNTMGPQASGATGNDAEETESESEEEARPLLKEEIELRELMQKEDDDDPMKAYMIQQKKEEVEVARMALAKRERKSKDGKHKRHRSHRSRKHEGSDDDQRERRRHRHRSRSAGQERPSKPRRRELSTTPVFDQGPEAPRSRKDDRSRSPYRETSAKAEKSKSRRKDRSKSRTRTPIYRSDDDSSTRRNKRERSNSRDRRR